MEVPLLSATEASHPELCVVASTPRPRQRLSSRIPTIDLWKEDEWKEHYNSVVSPPQQLPVWLVTALGTIILAVLLKASRGMPGWVVILCVLVGTALSCFFMARQQTLPGSAGTAVSVVGYVFLVLLAIPVVSIGVLFVGCAVCSGL
jgi:hypothetical protein